MTSCPSRGCGESRDVAAPRAAECLCPCRSALQPAETSQRGSVWIRGGLHQAAAEHLDAFRRGVAAGAFGADLIGALQFLAVVFEVANQAAAADAEQGGFGRCARHKVIVGAPCLTIQAGAIKSSSA